MSSEQCTGVRRVKKKGWEEECSDGCSRQLRSNLIGTAPGSLKSPPQHLGAWNVSNATTWVNNAASSFFPKPLDELHSQ
jgi:hypothetical protein